jgi:hypothetical protein
MSRVICWFSCGAASAVATKLTLAKYGAENVVIARCIVREEHEDNDRFAADCEKWFNHPITNLIALAYNGSVHNVIERRQYISGVKGAPCTRLLKKQVREEFQLATDTHIFGYTYDPIDIERFDRFIDANNIDVFAPLIEKHITHANCLSLVQDAGIELPIMYKLGYQHNNCIGCVKSSGAGYWNKIKIDFPVEFDRMATVSRGLGVRMVQITKDKKQVRIFLDELEAGTGRYQDEPEIQCGAFCEAVKDEIK